MKFLHTSDWQLGMKAAHAGGAGEKVREQRLASLGTVLDAAAGNGADFILVAGDLFEDNGVDRVLVRKAIDALARASMPVFAIPGNHDPLAPGSVWEHPAWSAAGNFYLLRQEQPVEVPGGFLYPCPARDRHSGKDPTAWIRASGPSEKGIRIGIAHGTVEGVPAEEPEYPVPRAAAARAGLDYLALGHYHSTAMYPGPDGVVRMAYSGSHEATRFGERDSGNALLVEIGARGAPPAVSKIATGRLQWKVIAEELRQAGDLPRVRQSVEALPDAAATLVEVRLSGLLAAADQSELDHLLEILAARFLFGRLDASHVRPSPQDESWVESLPAGVLREAALRLRQMAEGKVPIGSGPQVAAMALRELYALALEASR